MASGFIYLFLAALRATWDLSSLNLCPLHWQSPGGV